MKMGKNISIEMTVTFHYALPVEIRQYTCILINGFEQEINMEFANTLWSK